MKLWLNLSPDSTSALDGILGYSVSILNLLSSGVNWDTSVVIVVIVVICESSLILGDIWSSAEMLFELTRGKGLYCWAFLLSFLFLLPIKQSTVPFNVSRKGLNVNAYSIGFTAEFVYAKHRFKFIFRFKVILVAFT